MHVESTCICMLIDVPENNTGYTCWYCACWINLLYMLNLPAFACQSNVPKMTWAHVCYSCSVLKWHMRSQTRMLEQHRHWATHAHPVLNSGTFDWHAIACSFSTFFFGVLVQLGPWGVVGNGCLGITEHIESKLIIVFSQLGIYPTSVKVKKRHDCIGLWSKATGQIWVTNQDAVLIVIFIKMRAWPSYLSPTSYRKPSPYLVWQPRIPWRSMVSMGLLAPNTDNLCQFRHNSECSSSLLWTSFHTLEYCF